VTHDRTRIRNEPPVVVEDSPCAPPDPPWVRRVLRLVAAVAISALLAVGFLGYQLFRTEQRTHALEEYVSEVRSLRDQQNQAVNDRINSAVCAIMDRLPAGPLLNPIREDYGCGPGLNPATLSQEQLEEILRDYGPAALARTPGEFYELFPADPLGTGLPVPEYGAVPPID
jgi:hypothetical protein